ncbi:LPXTG cell wall anchor domain-containing protein [Erysipelotrichaceae bacterium AF15-26LB]|nr:GH32 C-terminal domain-containing protein [[Clostridium] innocuum]RJV86273.1 LPXTG cell wall anchor domain-containing protein [Erysipelotrichaceae bacterium AF15-26LB]RJV87295.1 LPXTG cell wall anchor domain-containing protein [Erysipelotrichaceae bacterium AF19-24AC]
MTRKMTRMLVAFMSCSMVVGNMMPYNVMAETLPTEQDTENLSSKTEAMQKENVQTITLKSFKGDNVKTEGDVVKLANTGTDNFAMSEDVKELVDDFHYSADATIKNGDASSAALLFGVGNRENPKESWRASNVIKHDGVHKMRTFRVPGDFNYQPMHVLEGYNPEETVHLELDVKANGDFIYTVTSEGGTENVMRGSMDDWAGGYIGLLAYNTEIEMTNIQFTDRTIRVDDSLFHTTVENLRGLQGSWKITENGMHSQGNGDNFAISDTKIENFEYSANINNLDKKGAGALMFRVQNPADPKAGCYVINADYTHNIFKLFEFPTGGSIAEVPLSDVEPNADGSYDIKVTVVGEDIYVYANGKGIMREKDSRHKGESYLGLLTWDGNIEYQNLNHKAASELPAVEEAKLSDFKILTDGVTITPTFDPDVKNYGMDIPAGVDRVVVKPESSGDVYITLKDRNNKVIKEKQKVTDTFTLTAEDFDMNFLNMGITIEKDGFRENINFAVNKWLSTAELAQQPYRAQFHVTPQINFMNDPNGMVYDSTDGYWHLFYQYSPNNNFYKQSQAHVRSKDLVNWEQQPLGLQIDEHGLIFSGSAVEDTENTSGLFDNNKSGESRLVSIYTYHNEKTGKQSQAIATSKDHGVTWQKYAGNPVLPNEDNTISGNDFRDPKVFQIDGDETKTWYMLTAGGAAQIFTSKDLIHWTRSQNLTYKNGDQIHSECPGLIPAKVNGTGETKWIYNGSAGFYVVGSMKKDENGIYKWSAESEKMDIDSNANPWGGFGKYATMTFYRDGTGKNRQIGISWLQDFIEFDGKTYKGLQSLPQEYGLKQDADGNYIVTSNVVEEVNALRDTNHMLYQTRNKKVSSTDANILRGVSGIRYDLEGDFTLGTAKEFGFKLRQGNGKELIFKYNKETQKMYVDGRNAGHYVNSGDFSYTLKPLAGNKVKLRIIIDQGAVEAFGNDGEANISTAMYQENSNIGMEFFCTEGDVTIDKLSIYDMKSMYSGKSGSESEATQLYVSASDSVEVGTEFRIDTNIYPNIKNQADITWSYDGLTLVKKEAGSIIVKAEKAGTYKVRASVGQLSKEITIKAYIPDFQTNITTWPKDNLNWHITGNGIKGKNTGGDSFFMTDTKVCNDQAFILEANMDITSGVAAGITFGVRDKENVQSSWFCANIERDDRGNLAKLFKNENREIWAVTKYLPTTRSSAPYHLKVVYDGAGKLTYYVNDLEIGSQENVDLPAEGFVGIQTFKSETVFDNVTITYPDAKAVRAEEAFGTVRVAYNEKAVLEKLPQRVNISYDNGAVLNQPITWDIHSVDTAKPGSYVVKGKAAGLDIRITVQVLGNKAELKKAVDAAGVYKESDYTAASWKSFTEALKAANGILESEAATQAEIDDALSKLNAAIKQLEKHTVKADKKELEVLLQAAKGIASEGYTKESFAVLEKAILQAEDVFANPDALQSEVDAAATALRDAVASLKTESKAADKKQLKELVRMLKDIKKDAYTASSWEEFAKALQQAEAILTDETASEADITKAYENLQRSYRALKPIKLEDEPVQGNQKPNEPDNSDTDNKNQNPDTGDTTSTSAAGLLMVAAGGIAVMIRRRKNKAISKSE